MELVVSLYAYSVMIKEAFVIDVVHISDDGIEVKDWSFMLPYYDQKSAYYVIFFLEKILGISFIWDSVILKKNELKHYLTSLENYIELLFNEKNDYVYVDGLLWEAYKFQLLEILAWLVRVLFRSKEWNQDLQFKKL